MFIESRERHPRRTTRSCRRSDRSRVQGRRSHPADRVRAAARGALPGLQRPRRFSESQRSFVLALGRQCAQALNRAQLYEAELEGRSRLSRLVERLQEGVVSFDRRGRVVFASSTAKRMLRAGLSSRKAARCPKPGSASRFAVSSPISSTPTRVVEAQVASQDGERVFDVTGIPAARAEAALVVVTRRLGSRAAPARRARVRRPMPPTSCGRRWRRSRARSSAFRPARARSQKTRPLPRPHPARVRPAESARLVAARARARPDAGRGAAARGDRPSRAVRGARRRSSS